MVGRVTGQEAFQARLNELFAAAPRRTRNATVARSLRARGCRISAPYLSQLRNGVRTNPSDGVVAALAEYFGVLPDYFFTIPRAKGCGDVQCKDAGIVERLLDPRMKELLEQSNGLSVRSLDVLTEMASKLRISDHCLPIPADSPAYVRLAEATIRHTQLSLAKKHTLTKPRS